MILPVWPSLAQRLSIVREVLGKDYVGKLASSLSETMKISVSNH